LVFSETRRGLGGPLGDGDERTRRAGGGEGCKGMQRNWRAVSVFLDDRRRGVSNLDVLVWWKNNQRWALYPAPDVA